MSDGRRGARGRVFLWGAVFLAVAVAAWKLNTAYGNFIEAWKRADCSSNPKQFGLVCKMFAVDNEQHFYPRLSSTPGKLMFGKEGMFPEYLTAAGVLVCPSVHVDKNLWQHPVSLIDDKCFLYLGYVVTGDADVSAFCEAYRNRVAQGLPFDADLKVPAGQGNAGGSTIYRLRDGVEPLLLKDATDKAAAEVLQQRIPVLIERPQNHRGEGGNVLFMDGQVEFIRYPGKWPMTPQTINALLELDAMRQ